MRQEERKKRATILFISIFIGLWIFLSQKFSYKPPFLETKQLSCADCNIILVSFDTLRAANLGTYGYKRNTTPTIDRFAQNGFIFTNAISVTSWTLPSTMSWFTGVYPSQHKVLNKFIISDSGEQKITNLQEVSPNTVTLAEALRQNGYRTGGFTGGAGVHRQFGFGQGFEVYTDDKDFAGFEESAPKALEWIEEHKNEKLFVFLHGYDIHGQFVPKDGYDYRFVDFDYQGTLTGSKEEQKELREEGLARGQLFLTQDDVRFLTALYDEKVSRADDQFAKFIDQYQKLGLMEKTIFIMTSDHGEELYEHGRIDHGHSLYEEAIRVPLIISVPKMKEQKTITAQVRSIDLMPTILELAKVNLTEPVLKQMVGTSLVSFMEGKEQSLDVFPETDYRYYTFQRAARTSDSWKYIFNLESEVQELYNLTKDPQEQKNIINRQNNKGNELDQKIKKHLEKI